MGCSFDKPAVNAVFKINNNFQYALWTDEERELALYYGAATSPTQLFASRVTVVIDPEGTWALVYPLVNPAGHPQQVLDDLTLILAP